MHKTDRQVLDFLRSADAQGQRTPSLDEIVRATPSLNHRSSALAAINRLLRQNLVVSVGMPGSARRYIPTSGGAWPHE